MHTLSSLCFGMMPSIKMVPFPRITMLQQSVRVGPSNSIAEQCCHVTKFKNSPL